ncbi:MAG: sugar ABC transporter permease, partial [Deltaproteobacteria bacterium]|nr:sugar ABC transporter permease [Deltaproteobacteria bacterium]
MRPFNAVSVPVAAGLIVGSLLAFSLGALFVTQASRDTVRLVQDRHGITQAMALTEVVAAIEAGKTGEDRAFGEAITIWTQAHPDVREVRVVRLSGARLLASTEKGDAARGRLPRRLTRDEKWLFDLGQRLRIARETNRDEGASRKKEIELNQLPGNLLQVSAPYLLHGDVGGFVQLKLQKPVLNVVTGREAAALSVIAVIALSLMTVMLLRQNRFMIPAGQGRSPGQLAVAAALLILGLLIFAATQFSALDAQRRSLEQRLAGQYASVRTTVDDIDRTLTLPHALPGENRWDVDEYRKPYRFTDGQGRLRSDALAAARSSQARELRRSLEGGGAMALFLLLFFGTGRARRLRETLAENREAYLYVSPAIIGMLILVFFPFIYGIALSFTDANIYNTGAHLKEIWIGFTNYLSILGDMNVFARSGSTWIVNYQNFYWTLYITIAWTIVNVAIGVSVGLLLALILNTKGLGMRTVYRVLLILPWAIPNYITA